jgi:adenosine 3'-phospho 5'-phosphosulfate transporter B3
MMSIGLIFFTLADVKVQPKFEFFGVILILGALVADAAIGNFQEKQMKLFKASNFEVVLYSYSIGFAYILIGSILFDKPFESLSFWTENPTKTFGYAFLFSLTGYLGINIVLHLVNQFGALIAVTGKTNTLISDSLKFVY